MTEHGRLAINGMLGSLDAMLNKMADDGLIYDRQDPRRPWNVGVGYGAQDGDEDYANLAGNGRAITGLLYWRQWTGDDVWRQPAKWTAERMLELAVTDGDLAFYIIADDQRIKKLVADAHGFYRGDPRENETALREALPALYLSFHATSSKN